MKTTVENLQALREYLFKKPQAKSTKWHKNVDIKFDTGKVLKLNGVIENYGSRRNPMWHWVGSEPSDNLLNQVLVWEREFTDSRYKLEVPEVRNEKRIESFRLDVIIPHLTCYTKNGAKVEFLKDSVVLNKNGHDLKIDDQDTLMKLINMI
jgi:hypothetical protein